MKTGKAFINSLCGFLFERALSTEEVTAASVFADVFEEKGVVFKGANAEAAGRLCTTDTRTQHHPAPPAPPSPPCGVAIIKMIYLTIGPRLRD